MQTNADKCRHANTSETKASSIVTRLAASQDFSASQYRSLSIKTQKLKVSQNLAVNKSGAQMGTVHPRLCTKGRFDRSYRNNKLNRCGPGVGKRDEQLMNIYHTFKTAQMQGRSHYHTFKTAQMQGRSHCIGRVFLGSSSPYSYTFGSLTLPPDVPAHTCATKHLSYVQNCSNARPLSLHLFEAVGVRCDSCWLCSASVTSGAVSLHTGASSPTLPV